MSVARTFAAGIFVVAFGQSGAAQGVDLYGDLLPDGAVARLGTIRYRQVSGFQPRVAFLADGHTLLAGAPGNAIKRTLCAIDARTGELLRELDLQAQVAPLFCLSVDGRTMATLSVHIVKGQHELQRRLSLWDVATWRELKQFTLVTWKMDVYPPSEPSTLAFSPDSKFLAVAASVGTGLKPDVVTLYSAETGEELRHLEAKPDDVRSAQFTALAFSPRGKLLALSSSRGVLLWEYYSEREPTLLQESPAGSQGMAFSHDGSLLAVGSHRHGIPATVYDVAARQSLPKLQGAGELYTGRQLAFSPDDGRLFVPTLGRGLVEVFDPRSGALLATWDSQAIGVGALAASADGQLVAGIGSQAIAVWDAATGARLDEKFVGHTATPDELAFTPDGQRIVTGAGDGTIRIWDAATSRQLHALRHDAVILALALSRDGSRLVSCGIDDTTRLWDLANSRELSKLELPGRDGTTDTGILEAVFSPDGARFTTFGHDMVLRTYDVATGQVLAEHDIRRSELPPRPQFGAGPDGFHIENVRFSPDGKQLLIGGRLQGAVHAFDVETGEELAVIKPEFGLFDNGFFVTSNSRYLATFELPPPHDPNDRTPLEGTSLRFRDMKTHEIVREFELPAYYGYQFALSPSGKLLACRLHKFIPETMEQRRTIGVFDMKTIELVAELPDPAMMYNAMAFSPDDARLITAEQDTTATVWELGHFRVDAVQP